MERHYESIVEDTARVCHRFCVVCCLASALTLLMVMHPTEVIELVVGNWADGFGVSGGITAR